MLPSRKRSLSLLVLAAVLVTPVIAEAQTRGVSKTWSKMQVANRSKVRRRGPALRRAKPSPRRIRRWRGRSPLVQKLKMRKRQDMSETELEVFKANRPEPTTRSK